MYRAIYITRRGYAALRASSRIHEIGQITQVGLTFKFFANELIPNC